MSLLKNPLVSIVMPVYNAEEYLEAAVESLIKQSYRNWELIAVDDHSKDNSLAMLRMYAAKDRRIKAYKNGRHRGVSGAANLALRLVKGDYIARMDADDISYFRRIEYQLRYLQKNKDVVAVGGQCTLIDSKGRIIGQKLFPLNDKDVRNMIFYRIPVQQPAIMVNGKRLPSDFVWYEDGFNVAEEVELLFKLFNLGRVENLSDKVLKYRLHDKNTSLVNPKQTFYLTLRTRIKAIFEYEYRPALKGVIITLVQFVVVTLLPGKYIYPIYEIVRDLRASLRKAILGARSVLLKRKIEIARG